MSVPTPQTGPTPSVSVENFGLLYDRYVTPVYRYLLSRVHNVADAEDLTAQTFLAALESLPRYRERGSFAAWLFQIARSKLMDHFRRARTHVSLEQTDIPVASDLLAGFIVSGDAATLQRLVAAITAGERELLRLRYVADLSFAEISTLLGKREETVKKSLYRLLARLTDQMEAQNA